MNFHLLWEIDLAPNHSNAHGWVHDNYVLAKLQIHLDGKDFSIIIYIVS